MSNAFNVTNNIVKFLYLPNQIWTTMLHSFCKKEKEIGVNGQVTKLKPIISQKLAKENKTFGVLQKSRQGNIAVN